MRRREDEEAVMESRLHVHYREIMARREEKVCSGRSWRRKKDVQRAVQSPTMRA